MKAAKVTPRQSTRRDIRVLRGTRKDAMTERYIVPSDIQEQVDRVRKQVRAEQQKKDLKA